MQIAEVQIEKVRPYPGNPRKNAEAVAKVAASLATFGWRQPIVVDEEFVVIAGHTRLLAAQTLGHSTVPVHVATGLTPEQVRAYRLADNRVAQEAEWDDDLLAQELLALNDAGFDLSLTGFDGDELSALLAEPTGLLPDADPDEVPEAPATPTTKRGDVYRLGPHRLVCGDSTDTGAWERLMGEERASLVWTDPPYGVAYVGGTKDKLTIENDDLGVDELTDFLRSSLGLASTYCLAGAPWYVAAPHGPPFLAFATVGHELGWWRQTIVWVKDVFALGRSDYHYRHEAILVGDQPESAEDEVVQHHAVLGYGWKPGASHLWHGGRKQDTVWDCPKPRANREHPTMKPVALIERALTNSSERGAIVVDPFGGSGSTLIAAESTGRHARLIELSEQYCDVIIQRWEAATGRKAERVST